jgi:hypothetical protein
MPARKPLVRRLRLTALAAALLLTTGCQSLSGRPAYSADPLLRDRKPVAGRAAAAPTLAEPQPPPAPPAAPQPERVVTLCFWPAL